MRRFGLVLVAVVVAVVVPAALPLPVRAANTVSDVLGPIASPDPLSDSSQSGYKYLGSCAAVLVDNGAVFNTLAAWKAGMLHFWASTQISTAQQCKSAVDTQSTADGTAATDWTANADQVAQIADWTVFTGACGFSSFTGLSGAGYSWVSGIGQCAQAHVSAGTNLADVPAFSVTLTNPDGAGYLTPNLLLGDLRDAGDGSGQTGSLAVGWYGGAGLNSFIAANGCNAGTPTDSLRTRPNFYAGGGTNINGGCGFGNAAAQGMSVGAQARGVAAALDQSDDLCSGVDYWTVGAVTPSTCNAVVSHVMYFLGSRVSSVNASPDTTCTSNCGTLYPGSDVAAGGVHFGRFKCLRDATPCDTTTKVPATPRGGIPYIPTTNASCEVGVNMMDTPDAVCAGTALNPQSPAPAPSPSPTATGGATEQTQLNILALIQQIVNAVVQLPGQMTTVISDIVALPDELFGLAARLGTEAPSWADYWRSWAQERIDHLSDLLTQVRDGIERIPTDVEQLPGEIITELIARLGLTLPSQYQGVTQITIHAALPLDPGGAGHPTLWPFSTPWDVLAIVQAFDVAPVAPRWSTDWRNPLDGSTMATTTISPTEACFGSSCLQLLDRDLGGGVTPMSLIRWGELVLIVIPVALRVRDWMGDGW